MLMVFTSEEFLDTPANEPTEETNCNPKIPVIPIKIKDDESGGN